MNLSEPFFSLTVGIGSQLYDFEISKAVVLVVAVILILAHAKMMSSNKKGDK